MKMLRRAMDNLSYLWSHAGLSFKPEIHGMIWHVAEQVENRAFGMLGARGLATFPCLPN